MDGIDMHPAASLRADGEAGGRGRARAAPPRRARGGCRLLRA